MNDLKSISNKMKEATLKSRYKLIELGVELESLTEEELEALKEYGEHKDNQ